MENSTGLYYLSDLREYIEELRKIGELVEVHEEVDWNLEIGAIIRRCYETGAPAPLFSSIKGINHGFRILGAPAGVSRQRGLYLSRVAISLGLNPRASGPEIVQALVDARKKKPLPPQVVKAAPCKQSVLIGDKVDLLDLPTPLIHDGDGGRYINTWGTIVVRSPDRKWTNWSIARVMLLDSRRMT